MKIHYFQRYHSKENVATANTMLLLSRLYSYSSDKFFRVLKSECFQDSFDPEITFDLQSKSKESVPDATITQEGFKIVNFNISEGELTKERKQKIQKALEDGDSHGYNLREIEHRYFFVEKFYETDFKKSTPKAPWGSRIFDLSQILRTDELPEVEVIAEELRKQSWT